jgi:hypothetical protein
MERYTRKHAESAFDRLVKVLGQRQAQSWNDVGGWTLDYNSAYGGFVVEEISSESAGVSHPFGPMRRSARDFCDAVRFVEDALRAMQR